MAVRIIVGHVLDRLRELPAESVHCCVTSPPYYGLRDYKLELQVWGGEPPICGGGRFGEHEWSEERKLTMGRGDAGRPATMVPRGSGGKLIPSGHSAPQEKTSAIAGAHCRRCGAWRGSLGLEPTLDLYLEHVVEICREIRRVLRKDGTFWLNIGDAYAGSWGAQGRRETPETLSRNQINNHPKFAKNTGSRGVFRPGNQAKNRGNSNRDGAPCPSGLKPKDLMLIPARLAIRLCDDGWWVRSDIAWAKRAPMPESCTDRPTSAWEHVFLLTKSGNSLFWTHRDRPGTRTKPAPDYRWVDHASEPAEYEGKWSGADDNSAGRRMLLNVRNARAAGADHDNPFNGKREPLPETDVEPPNWRTEILPEGKRKRWSRINFWTAHDYFYDAEAVKEEAERAGDIPGGANYGRGAPQCDDPNVRPGWGRLPVPAKRNLRNFWEEEYAITGHGEPLQDREDLPRMRPTPTQISLWSEEERDNGGALPTMQRAKNTSGSAGEDKRVPGSTESLCKIASGKGGSGEILGVSKGKSGASEAQSASPTSQAPNRDDIDERGMGGDQRSSRPSMPLLQTADEEADYGPCDSDQQRRTSRGIEHRSSLSGVQFTEAQSCNQSALTNVWKLGPLPFPEAHFATFVPEIPRRCILAGTSERGVCPKCGAPWARVTETRQEATQATNNHGKASADNGWSGNTDRYPRTRRVDETLGWRATCSCDAGHPVPATILDPFLGAGTTALVADRLGRDCIGIELSPVYAEMARRRIAEDAGLFSPLQDAAE